VLPGIRTVDYDYLCDGGFFTTTAPRYAVFEPKERRYSIYSRPCLGLTGYMRQSLKAVAQ
jgi:hypothetical protein